MKLSLKSNSLSDLLFKSFCPRWRKHADRPCAKACLCPLIARFQYRVYAQNFNKTPLISKIIYTAAIEIIFWTPDEPRFDRIIVKIIQFLLGNGGRIQFNWMIILLPELKCYIVTVLLACTLHHPQHPFPSAFFIISRYCRTQFFRSMSFISRIMVSILLPCVPIMR